MSRKLHSITTEGYEQDVEVYTVGDGSVELVHNGYDAGYNLSGVVLNRDEVVALIDTLIAWTQEEYTS